MSKITTHIAKIKNVDFPSTSTAVISFTNPETESVDVLMKSDEWGMYLKEYLSWCYIALGDEPENETETYSSFVDVWNSFFLNRYSNYQKVYTAIMEEYDPIENYNKISQIKTKSGTRTDTQKNATFTDSNINPTVTSRSEEGVSSYDSVSYSNRNKVTSTVDPYTVQVTHGSHDDDFVKGEQNDQVDEHTHGNIGVTTNMTMLTEEKNGRKFNFLKDIISDFAKECLFLCEIV